MLNLNHFTAEHKKKIVRVAALLLPIVTMVLLLSQTAFAKNTYLINDGGRVVLHTTYATDPAMVLHEAGLVLNEDDIYTTQPGLGVSEINVQRKQMITISYGGEILNVASYGETVDSLLQRLSLTPGKEDVVSVPLRAQTYDGMIIHITQTVQTEETYVAIIPFETIYCYDATLEEGEEKVLTVGVNGQMRCVASVIYSGGEEVSRTVISQDVLLQPTNAVVATGTYVEQVKPEQQPTVPAPEPKPELTGKPIIGDGFIQTPEGEVLTYTHVKQFKATAYHNSDPGCTIWTSTGTLCRVGAIAVDPTVIPYGTRMYIVSNDGQYIYGIAVAEDCGSAIKGNRIDLYYNSVEECNRFGIRDCQVYFLG